MQFTVLNGGGYIIENQPILTGADGMAKATYILGPNAGQNTIEATAINLSALPIGFTATGKVGTATQMQSLPGSNGQTGVAGELLPSPVGVVVMDGNGDPIADHNVTFSISFGGGSVNDAQETTVATDPFGEARAFWRLGDVSGPNVLEAASQSLGNAKEIFTAPGVEGQAAFLEISGNATITGTVSGQASRSLTVRVVDKHGNPVKNFIVRYQIIKGTGSLSSTEATTNSDGYASVSFTFGNDAGERLVRAFGTGLANSPVNFKLVGNAASPKSIAVYDGNNQTGTIGKTLSRPTRAIVKDSKGNPVPGVNVSFIPTLNNGSFVGGPVVTTDERGLAAAIWNLGTNTGSNKAWAIVQGLPQVEFIANGVSNNLPVFQEIAAQEVNELEKVEFSVTATDADGETISYGVRNLPPGAGFDSLVTRIFIWNTGYDNAGLHEVVFTARDSKGDLAEYVVPITVNNLNQAPRITNWQPAADNILVMTGQTQKFEVSAIDPDGEELGCLWFLDGRHVGSSHTYFYQPSTTGARTLEAKIFDEADTTSRSWRLDVITSV
ncbi:MAG: Ig-like domain-containing protein, partial [bacterium]